MSLDPLHEQILRIAFALPEADQIALAGGGAMIALGLVERPTQDVDLFTPRPAEVEYIADAMAKALRAIGAQIDVDRRGPTFVRLLVTMGDQTQVAGDKMLALFGRACEMQRDSSAYRPGGERLERQSRLPLRW